MKKTIALVAIVKDEGKYLLEWIAHYRLIGIPDIVIYDNDSSDEGRSLLDKLAASGIIKLHHWTVSDGISPQLSAYTDALKRYENEFEFIAFFDADEFLVQRGPIKIADWLRSLSKDAGAIAINQRVFGSSGHESWNPGLVMERFKRAAEENYDENKWVKSIYRPTHVDRILNPHRAMLKCGVYKLPSGHEAFSPEDESGRAVMIDFSFFQLNHYIIKSKEEFLTKRLRGGGAGATAVARAQRYHNMDFFHGRDAMINKVVEEALAGTSSCVHGEMGRLLDHVR